MRLVSILALALLAAAPALAQRTGTVSFTDGSVWTGGISPLDGSPSGEGVLTEPDGTTFRGRRLVGRWVGRVTIDTPDGMRMTRDVLAGLPNGEWTWTLPSGAHLATVCRPETGPHTATFVHADGERVSVEIDADCLPAGDAWERAVVVDAIRGASGDPGPSRASTPPASPASSGGPGSGAVGDLADSQRWCLSGDCQSGRGRMRLPGGEVYTGTFQNGERHGQGTLVVPGQGTYTGAWERDYRHGTGEFVFENGGVFTGEFYAGSPHDGRREWPGGEVYTGRLHRWQASGRGVFRWPSGATHSGLFRDGEPHGVGTRTLPDGRAWTGEWAEGRPEGEGVWRDADGRPTRRGPY